MRTRAGYVSNSSSSSFLLPCKPVVEGVDCIKLPKEVWQAIARNHVESDGRGYDMSCSDEWWLTEMVSDCMEEEYSGLCGIPGSIQYLEGNSEPYGAYEYEEDYIVFSKQHARFYVLATDFIGADGEDEIPEAVMLRDKAKSILSSKLNKTQKLNLIERLFNF